MTEPARWSSWRTTGYPQPQTAVLITVRDLEGEPYVEFGEWCTDGPWMFVGGGTLDETDVLAWMPCPPPYRNDCDSTLETTLPDDEGQEQSI